MGSPILLASLATLGYAAWYSIMCMVAPFGRCWHCHNRKKRRDCRWCDGTRRRIRIGRRIFEYIRAEYDRGAR